MPDPDISFAALLRQQRLAAGLTQEALAERARLSWRTISDLERGVKHRPHQDTVLLPAEALELNAPERHPPPGAQIDSRIQVGEPVLQVILADGALLVVFPAAVKILRDQVEAATVGSAMRRGE
jgi:transcriptional regulator with XRE-family HTH domain